MIGVLGMLLALMGSTLSGNGPRMTFGIAELGNGLPLSSAILGVLIIGEVFIGIEEAARDRIAKIKPIANHAHGDNRFRWADIKQIMPVIFSSTIIGTVIGALPGIGTTLAATLGYDYAKRFSKTPEKYGTGIPEGVAATEAANSSVSGANLIPVMSLGIPGNFAAVFIILAVESVGDFTLGPQVFRFTEIKEIAGYGTIINKDLVIAFAMFTLMVIAKKTNTRNAWLASRAARWQQLTNTSSGTVRMLRISSGPRKLPPESTTPPSSMTLPVSLSRLTGSPWPATCTMR